MNSKLKLLFFPIQAYLLHEVSCKEPFNSCRPCKIVNHLLRMHASTCSKDYHFCPVWRCHEIRHSLSLHSDQDDSSQQIQVDNSVLTHSGPYSREYNNIDDGVFASAFNNHTQMGRRLPMPMPRHLPRIVGVPIGTDAVYDPAMLNASFSQPSFSHVQQSSNSHSNSAYHQSVRTDIPSHEDTTCVVCKLREKAIVLFPCNHFCLCAECNSSSQFKYGLSYSTCPVCSEIVLRRLEVFWP